MSDISHHLNIDCGINAKNIESLAASLWQMAEYPWFEECFQRNVPGCVPRRFSQKEVLQKCGLIEANGKIRYRVNVFRDCIFITDGPWNIRQGGVFPFSDESELILKYIEDNGIDSITKGIFDLGCGCGHSVIAYWGRDSRLALDINPRAGFFVEVNAVLNKRKVQYVRNDILNGLSLSLDKILREKPLFVSNMPHALSSLPDILPRTSDGGETGIKWTMGALRAITRFIGSGGTAVFLCYSLGNHKEDKWDVVEKAARLFRKNIKWEILKNTHIWRINGKKEQPNPMSLRDGLPKKADCGLYVKDEDRKEVRQRYIQLVKVFENKGWDVLGCGILEIKL